MNLPDRDWLARLQEFTGSTGPALKPGGSLALLHQADPASLLRVDVFVLIDGHGDQVLGLRKEEKQKQKAQGKGETWYEPFGLEIETLSECDHI